MAAGLLLAAGCSGGSDDAAPSESADAAPLSTCVDEVPTGDDAEAIAATVDQLAADAGLTSVLYRVTRDDDLIAAGAVGESITSTPVDPAMRFRVGNVAFGYMGTLLLLMVEDGDAALDDPISTWLPHLDVPNTNTVTLEMLVRNTSGYPDYVGNTDFEDAFNEDPFGTWTPEDLLDVAFEAPVLYEPGTAWNYSHTNYVILGAALEQIGGADLATLLSERVIDPLGLAATSPQLDSSLPAPVLQSYTSERDVFEDTTYWNPSWQTAPGGIVASNICDLVTSAAAIGSGELLSEASYETFVDDQVVELGPPPASCGGCTQMTPERYYGLGVLVFNGWVAQAPLFAGTGGVNAYLPGEDISIAIQTVAGADTEVGVNHAMVIWNEIALQLTPDDLPLG
ncbi:MAG: serine hydrolase domain-containing protein [Ilumatobacteraceae bacterium]